jgi:aspartate aminotransferase
MKTLAKRLERISPSATVAIDSRAKELKARGIDVISLGAGEPDFDTPEYIKEAAYEAIRNGKNKYSAPAGIAEVRASVCNKLKRENKLDYKAEQIVISSGAKHCISNSLAALIDEGDEVIVPAPYWVTYPDLVRFYGGKAIIVPTSAKNNFCITPEQLEQAITPKTKLLILNSPTNPTGSVYSAELLQKLARIIVKHDLYCLSDEIYEHLVYDQATHTSIAACHPEMPERTLVINGVSKAHAMTGWRMGYVAAPPAIASAIAALQGQLTHHPANASQYAAAAALDNNLQAVKEMRTAFAERRDYAWEALNKIEGLSCLKPQGAFYLFLDIRHFLGKKNKQNTLSNSAEICQYLLDDFLVATVPGSAFGMEAYMRISYATSMEQLQEAIKRIRTGLENLSD